MRWTLRVALHGIGAGFLGCTFTGVGSYDITRCDAGGMPASLDVDPCNALNTANAPTACEAFQCNAATGICKQGPLDFDRDGDLPLRCGGHDCDDRDGRRASGRAEICDGVDNDCDGLADAELDLLATDTRLARVFAADASLSSAGGGDVVGASVVTEGGASCLLAFRPTGEPIGAPCTFKLPLDVDLRQPWVHHLAETPGTLGAVFVDAGSACAAGRVGYRNSKGGGLIRECDASGTRAPSFLSYPTGDVAVVASLGAAVQADPLAGCKQAKPSPLDIAWIEHTSTLDPPPRIYAQHLALGASRSIAPPALAPHGDAVLIAAPVAGAAAMWLLRAPKPDGSGESIIPLLDASSLAGLADARSVALAVPSGGARFALVAALGCPPAQRIVLTLANLVEPGPIATVLRDVELASDQRLATHPRVAWLAARKEWWVSWIGESAAGIRTLSVWRISEDGERVEELPPSANGVRAAMPLADGTGTSVVVSLLAEKGLGAATFGCP